MTHRFSTVSRDERGSVAVEYGLIPFLIALLVFNAAIPVASKIRATLDNVSTTLQPGTVIVMDDPSPR